MSRYALLTGSLLVLLFCSTMSNDIPRARSSTRATGEHMPFGVNSTLASQRVHLTAIDVDLQAHVQFVHPRTYHRRRTVPLRPTIPIVSDQQHRNVSSPLPNANKSSMSQNVTEDNIVTSKEYVNNFTPDNTITATRPASTASLIVHGAKTAFTIGSKGSYLAYKLGVTTLRWIYSQRTAEITTNSTANDIVADLHSKGADKQQAAVTATLNTTRSAVEPTVHNQKAVMGSEAAQSQAGLKRLAGKRIRTRSSTRLRNELTALRAARLLQVQTIETMARQLAYTEERLHNVTQALQVSVGAGVACESIAAADRAAVGATPVHETQSQRNQTELDRLVNVLDLLSHLYHLGYPMQEATPGTIQDTPSSVSVHTEGGNQLDDQHADMGGSPECDSMVDDWRARLAEFVVWHHCLCLLESDVVREGSFSWSGEDLPIPATPTDLTDVVSGLRDGTHENEPAGPAPARVLDDGCEGKMEELQAQLQRSMNENAVLRRELNIASTLLCELRGQMLYSELGIVDAGTHDPSDCALYPTVPTPAAGGIVQTMRGLLRSIIRLLTSLLD